MKYTKDKPLKVFTAFSGYDSQCLALNRLKEQHDDFDYDLVGWSEIDKRAITAHNLLFPNWEERNYGDISKIDWTSVPNFDMFTYSFPCTDISMAGLRKGFAEGSNTRSSLLWECRKAIKAKMPKYLLLENVKALVQKKNMPLFQKWLSELNDFGYQNFWQVLNAKDYGIPQNRERVFVVSIRKDCLNNFPFGFKFPEKQKATKTLSDILEDESEIDEKYYLPHDSEAYKIAKDGL